MGVRIETGLPVGSAGAELDSPLQQRNGGPQVGIFSPDVEQLLAEVDERGRQAADEGCGQGYVRWERAPRLRAVPFSRSIATVAATVAARALARLGLVHLQRTAVDIDAV